MRVDWHSFGEKSLEVRKVIRKTGRISTRKPKVKFASRRANRERRKRREALMSRIIDADGKAGSLASNADRLRRLALESGERK